VPLPAPTPARPDEAPTLATGPDGHASTARTAAHLASLPLPLALAARLLDVILWLTWRFAERPHPANRLDGDYPTGSTLFHCPKCEQPWIAPPSLSRTFVFRCGCGERMIVHLDLASAGRRCPA
jgi:hypothetical protein